MISGIENKLEIERKLTLTSVLPANAMMLECNGGYWRPNSCGYTNAIVDAGIYQPGFEDSYVGHSNGVSASSKVGYVFVNGETPLTLVLDELARLRAALDLVRRGPDTGASEFARRVLVGEPPAVAKGALVLGA